MGEVTRASANESVGARIGGRVVVAFVAVPGLYGRCEPQRARASFCGECWDEDVDAKTRPPWVSEPDLRLNAGVENLIYRRQ